MKVLHILYKLMPSGAEKMLADASELFASNGVECWILANDDEEGVYAPTLRERGYSIVRIPWKRGHLHILDFWSLCHREKFDAVHIHVIRGYLSFAIVAKLSGVRTVVKTFHGIFTARDPLRWCMHAGKRFWARLAGVKMVAISRSVQENEYKTFRNKCHLVWNYADESRFLLADAAVGVRVRRALNIAEDAFVLLSVGNCHAGAHAEIKNHPLIIRAIAALPEEIRRHLAYLHVGAEQPDCPERKLAATLGVADNVKFLGSRSDIYELLCAANVYLMSSLHEGLGISTIEAAFAGREMILTRVQGLKDFGTVLSSGVAYCDLTPASMAAAIQDAFSQREAWQCTAGNERMRADALSVFSLRSGVERLVKFYRTGKVDGE